MHAKHIKFISSRDIGVILDKVIEPSVRKFTEKPHLMSLVFVSSLELRRGYYP